jgi:hypothetical protein
LLSPTHIGNFVMTPDPGRDPGLFIATRYVKQLERLDKKQLEHLRELIDQALGESHAQSEALPPHSSD